MQTINNQRPGPDRTYIDVKNEAFKGNKRFFRLGFAQAELLNRHFAVQRIKRNILKVQLPFGVFRNPADCLTLNQFREDQPGCHQEKKNENGKCNQKFFSPGHR